MMKRCLSLLLVVVMFVGMLPAMTQQVSAATQMDRLTEIYTELWPTTDPDNHPSFFTVNGKACTHQDHTPEADACTNCHLPQILKMLNNQNAAKFGNAYKLYGNAVVGGRTCVAFQRFVWLYVFEAREWVSSEYTIVSNKLASNYNNMKVLKAGDTLDFYSSNGVFYHSAIFLSCDQNKVKLLDCNWKGKSNGGSYGAAIVRVREVSYSSLQNVGCPKFTAKRANTAGSAVSSHPVALDPTYLTLPVGASFDFSKGQATETTANWKDLSWKSSNSKIASVSGGVVTGKSVGETTVTVSTASGSTDSVTFNIVQPSYNCAERWTITTENGVGPRVGHYSTAERSARYPNGKYVVWPGDPVYILSRYTESNGTLWGFGGGYSSYLDQNIWGWYNLVDSSLGSEQYDYTYMPASPTVNVQKKSAGVATVSWNPVTQATYYNLYQDGTLIRSNIQGTSADVDMEIGTTKRFVVESVNGNFAYNGVFCAARKSAAVSFTMPGCAHDYEVDFEWLNNYSCTATAECSLCDESTEGHRETKACRITCDNGTVGEMTVTAAVDYDGIQYCDSKTVSGTMDGDAVSIQLPLQLTEDEMIIVAGYNADGMLIYCKLVTESIEEIREVEGDSVQVMLVDTSDYMPLLSKFQIR